jgi:CheY-like chemotaxis protein
MIDQVKILIVDDNEKDVKLLNDYLVIHKFFVFTAKNGEDAFNQIQAQLPDLIIMDIMMPDMSCWSTCNKIKKDPLYRHIPILMCSAYIEDDGEFSKHHTADGYIQKPIILGSLLSTIQKLLEKKYV